MRGLLERLQQALADRYTIERELGAGGMAMVQGSRVQARTDGLPAFPKEA